MAMPEFDRDVPDHRRLAADENNHNERCPMCFYRYIYVYNPFIGGYVYQYQWVCV